MAASILLAASITPAASEPTALLIQKSLDGPAAINFQNITLAAAFDQVGRALEVPLEPEQSALDLLPYGELTQLQSVQLQGMSWRDALRELLKPLALTYEVGQDRIFIIGSAELKRQPRRLNMIELAALVSLQTAPLNDSEDKLLKQIRQITQTNFNLVEFGRRAEEAEKDIAEKILTRAPQPASQVLDRYSNRLGHEQRVSDATWYVRADMAFGRADSIDIMLVPAQQLLLMKLDRRVTSSYDHLPVHVILQDLASKSNVPFRYEPGCFGLLEDSVRNNTSLVMREGTVKTALDALSGLTGLEYEIEPDGLRIQAGETLRQLAQTRQSTSRTSNPTVSVITVKIPGTEMETMIFVRQEDLEEMGLTEKYRRFYLDSVKSFFDYLVKYPSPD
ncbi:MAG: STN domain-containing protein [Sedimentisphaerales bacterium]|nr:STN domain-containing protein [Sedimentisphaerales bacterium]